jgi:PAS domain S-box-containing protein
MSVQEQKTILLVEDEVPIAIDEAQTITSFGYHVITVHSGEKAVEIAIGNESIGLILMDIDLGKGINGPEAAKQILEKRSIPIVFLTSPSEKEAVDQLKGITRYGYAIKNSGDLVLRSSIELAFELFGAKKNLQVKMEALEQAHDELEQLAAERAEALRRTHEALRAEITERHRVDKALRESEDRYRRITAAVTDYTFTVLVDHGRVVKTIHGPTCIAVTGYSEEEFAANPYLWFTMILSEDRERVKNHAALILSGNDPGEIEHRIWRKDGAMRWVVNTPVPQRDSSGAVIAYDGLIRDITKRKRAEEEKAKFEALNRQLQKAESLGRMAGAVAHHFNNQLQAVMGNLEMAMEDLPRDEGPVERLIDALQAARKAAEVSSLMLIYLGQASGKREPLDLSEVCRRSQPLLQAAIPKNVVLETDWPSPGPVVSANANQIQQVLTNLATNAWEAVGDGRRAIRLTVKTVSPADIPTLNRFPLDWQPQANAHACLEVRDTGCGIAREDMEELFDPFFSRKFTGRGLGLPVVLGIVRAHGGAVTVETEPDQGSVFRVFFPLSAEEVPRRLEKTALAPEIQGGVTVLVVEDEETVRTMAATMLTRLGYTVLTAKDGAEAVEVFRQRQEEIRCVLCDLTMPRLNGWETLTALRQLEPDIPVILASGYDQAQVMSGDHPDWPQVFLSKPYNLKGLSEAICEALVSKK